MSQGALVVRYSEAFKRQVVRELEEGALRDHGEARRRYGIRGKATVARWVRRYGSPSLQTRLVRVEKPDEKDVIKKMQLRERALEKAVAESRMRELLMEGHFLELCERLGLDPQKEKKKLHEAPSSGQPIKERGKKG